jgi:hypothetical protein
MVRKLIRATLFAALSVVVVTLAAFATPVTAGAKDDKLPDIAEIMKKGHAKSDGYITKIRTAVKGQNWEDAQKYAKDFAILGDALGKNKPPKGTEKSWEALSKKYANNTKLVLKGTEDKDAKTVNKGLGGINCAECHKAHKG